MIAARRRGPVTASLLVAAVLAPAACTSPESTRLRGGGPGADPGNRVTIVEIHEGSQPYHATPRLIGRYGLEDR